MSHAVGRTFGRQTFCRPDISSTRRFVNRRFVDRTFSQKDVLPTAFWSTDVPSNGRFVDYFSLNGLLLILFDRPIMHPGNMLNLVK